MYWSFFSMTHNSFICMIKSYSTYPIGMYCTTLAIPYPNLRFFPKPTAKQPILFGLGYAPAAKIASPRIEKVALKNKKVSPSEKKVATSSNALFFTEPTPSWPSPTRGRNVLISNAVIEIRQPHLVTSSTQLGRGWRG